MYAIIFNIDTNFLVTYYDDNISKNAHNNIRLFMEKNNFTWQQGEVYFGNEKINAVSCVITIQNLLKKYPWFNFCVKNLKMLRIENIEDLMPTLLI